MTGNKTTGPACHRETGPAIHKSLLQRELTAVPSVQRLHPRRHAPVASLAEARTRRARRAALWEAMAQPDQAVEARLWGEAPPATVAGRRG